MRARGGSEGGREWGVCGEGGGGEMKGKRRDWAQQLLQTCQLPLIVSETH